MSLTFACFTIDCTSKWIGNAVQNILSSTVRSRDKIGLAAHTRVYYLATAKAVFSLPKLTNQ